MRIWVLVCLLTAATHTYGATRYVSPAGNDSLNDCLLPGSPCFSIEYAVDQALEGDTIDLLAGTYTEADIDVDKSLIIQGPDSATTIVQAAPALGLITNRVFDFKAGQTSSLNRVTVQHGFLDGDFDGAGLRNRGTLTVAGCVFTNNSAGDNGGAIYATAPAVLVITNTSFYNNTTGDKGGAIYTTGDLVLNTGVYRGNIASDNGGAIYSTSPLFIHQADFINNSSSNNGGAVYSVLNLELTGSSFSSNSATGNGGAINGQSDLSVDTSTLGYNTAGLNGGGIHCVGSLNIGNSQIYSNTASAGNGGAIDSQSDLSVDTSTLGDNTAGLSGGGIHCVGSLDIGNSQIYSNTASAGNGGAIDSQSDLSVDTSTVEFNTAGLNGGGIHCIGSLDIGNSQIYSNTASSSGGGFWSGSNLTLTASSVNGNSAVTNIGGGFRSFGSSATISDCTIHGNFAGLGGGGMQTWNQLLLENSTISSNTTTGQGGGLWNSSTGTARVERCTISDNSANGTLIEGFTVGGGGIQNDGAMTIENSTLSHNTAARRGGGVRNNLLAPRTLQVQHCTITSNSAQNGGGIYNEQTPNTFFIKHTLVAGNTATVSSPDGFGLITSEGYNLIEDPSGLTFSGSVLGNITGSAPLLGLLQDNGGPTLTHALLAGSPALDSGDPTFIPPPFSDQRGLHPRSENGRIDIGAFELTDGDDDNDNDDLPDTWEISNQLNPNDPTGDEGGGGNPDLDPSTNLEEYIADTLPGDSNSFWRLEEVFMTGSIAVTYQSSTGRVYTLQQNEGLEGGSWTQVAGQVQLPGTGGTDTVLEGGTNNVQLYRVLVELP